MTLLFSALYSLYSASRTIDAFPIIQRSLEVFHSDATLPGCECPDTRSIWNIVWSCLATMFACTWVSVHPNIPAPHETWWGTMKIRFVLMLWTVITPELTIFWAMRQWNGAKKLERRYSDYHWTRTHGHFLQMGGFMLYRPNGTNEVLSPDLLDELIQKKVVQLPIITEREINDRSKGDPLAKAIVVIQTSWFIVNCIARASQKLAITELEIFTLAFAMLNAIMYFFWWHKPLDIQCFVPVYLLDESQIPSPEEGSALPSAEEDQGSEKEGIRRLSSEAKSIHSDSNGKEPKLPPNRLVLSLRQLFMAIRFVFKPIMFIFHRLSDMSGSERSEAVERGSTFVPMFYSIPMNDAEDYAISTTGLSIAAAFGSIHCLAWNFHFLTTVEKDMWRACAVFITSLPVLMVFTLFFDERLNPSSWKWLAWAPFFLVLAPSTLLYIPARVALFLLALVEFRGLPSGAYDEIRWASFIPHI